MDVLEKEHEYALRLADRGPEGLPNGCHCGTEASMLAVIEPMWDRGLARTICHGCGRELLAVLDGVTWID